MLILYHFRHKMSKLIQTKIFLDEKTDQIVRDHIKAGGFGGKGLSAAVRNIIIEWRLLRSTMLGEARFKITAEGQQALEDPEPEPLTSNNTQ